MKSRIILAICQLVAFFLSFSQSKTDYSASSIKHALDKLNVLGSVLYIAAHPDDENTALISFYANERKYETAYLSATRGDGGQNLIGPQIREELGIIRTQELLAARRTDGGKQFFTRANDFGYSKHPDETFNIWEKDKVLEDMVWCIRKLRPDVLITRFSTQPGITHGHHTASAILAEEAFDLAGDPKAYESQLEFVDPWQPKKLFWNTSWWFYRNSGQKMDTASLISLNVGGYNPLLGMSYPEIAALSRSQHKSQGFGSSGSRGDRIEYLKQLKGAPSNSVFDGIDTSWDRVVNSNEVSFFIKKAIAEFDVNNPSAIVPDLLAARSALSKLEDNHWASIKKREIDDLIKRCAGLFFRFVADKQKYVPGDSILIDVEVINRSNIEMLLSSVDIDLSINATEFSYPLLGNKSYKSSMQFTIPERVDLSHPYWLNEDATVGMYSVEEQELIGKPENDSAIAGSIRVKIGNQFLSWTVPVVYSYIDPVKGEVIEPLMLLPKVTLSMNTEVMIFADQEPKLLEVKLSAMKKVADGKLSLDLPKGWQASPESYSVPAIDPGEEQVFGFNISPSSRASEGEVQAIFEMGSQRFDRSLEIIDYSHFPLQSVLSVASTKVVKLDLQKKGSLLGYIEGAGDAIPDNLRQLGYKVDLLAKEDIRAEDLKKYDAIVLGIRAFNTVKWLALKNAELFKYAENGGTLIVQYNKSYQMVTKEVAPFDLKISRDRVSVENAPVTILEKDHPVLNYPNKITKDDFEGWIQERGLYFPNEWSKELVPIIASNDPGESPKKGGLLVARHGKGYYVYTGYSWFRELPAGVPGAYRLFVNLISLGK